MVSMMESMTLEQKGDPGAGTSASAAPELPDTRPEQNWILATTTKSKKKKQVNRMEDLQLLSRNDFYLDAAESALLKLQAGMIDLSIEPTSEDP